ncbi:MAG: DUF2202 domain-containing protein [Sphaerochaetaceae bacterium]|jgi:hypothetical protein|nr:DUF2202 domain-containing protein [Sphaerochaetaceae bacterium]MDD2405808.1 DUF2202 domain-containing protein [Sphaerochaetaceae bacterium]MDD3669673.1 DUF2202 domain-containing protein [Sphaerochaetaceae bacterium]MDD4258358.1 DUF2202 domain-containing protein [Sphaerochaetaceae bacterium]MDD4762700.1 DUF2202 domain-containing protein [Sphaerochaetaceae bacterium]
MNIVTKKTVVMLLVAIMAATAVFAQGALEASGAVTMQQILEMKETETKEITDHTLGTETTLEEGIIYMREEEKLARDVYLAMYERWGIRIFANIARAEQRHMDAVAALMKMKDVSDTVGDADVGFFTIPEIKELYTVLVEKGSQSVTDAFIVGATIEDMDIADLEAYISQTEDPDAVLVYSRLLAGSENHMFSFIAQLNRMNYDYQPQYISKERLAEIINAR